MKTIFKILPFYLLAIFSNTASASTSALLISTSDGNGADTFIAQNHPTTAQGERKAILAYLGDSNNVSLSYIRFDLSAISSPITDVSLSLTSLISSTASLQIYGLNDGHINENWSETATTWNNAPAFLQDNNGLPVASETTLLETTFTGTSADSSVSFGSEALTSFVQNDTNNLVTFILRDDYLNGLLTDALFYSKENTTNSAFAPTLYVTTVPVPSAIWLFGSALIGLIGSKRKSI